MASRTAGGLPVYVHAKVCVIDDWWATIGSDNFNRRCWTHDSELSAVVLDSEGGDHSAYARRLRLTLAAEHLDRKFGPEAYPGDISALERGRTPQDLDDSLLLQVMADCLDPHDMYDAFASSADALQAWYDDGHQGERPPGRLRPASPTAPVAGDASLGRAALPRDPRPRRAAQGAAPTARVLRIVVRALSCRTAQSVAQESMPPYGVRRDTGRSTMAS